MRASRRILCVEDQADLLDDLVLELSDHGYRVEGCRDGHAALALFSAERFDLIICDIQLPGMGGIELLNRVRQLPEERSEVPAIFLSAFGDPEVVRAGTAQGAVFREARGLQGPAWVGRHDHADWKRLKG